MATLNPLKKREKALAVQVRRAKAVLRGLREALEDLEDHNALIKAKKKNAGKPLLAWDEVAKELGIPKPPRKR